MFNSLWWGSKANGGKGISWMRWDLLCKPKKMGGSGFKRLHEFNMAMLSKKGWKLVIDPSSLVAQIFKAKYYPHFSFLHASLGSNPRYIWQNI